MTNNILILCNTLKSGGAEKQSVLLYNALDQEYNTYFVVLHGCCVEDKIRNLFENKNAKVILLKGNSLYKLFKLYHIFHSYKINHLFTYLSNPNLIGGVIGKLRGVKYIYGGIRSTELPTWKTAIEYFVNYFLSTYTIYNSFQALKIFEAKGFKKGVVIPNCFINIDDPRKRNQCNINNIITIGRFVEQKDYNTALRSIKILIEKKSNFTYTIVGYGKLEKNIRKKVIELELEKNIQILINPTNIYDLLLNADIYLSTSLYEGTSNSIMEAMNASLPIVATNVGDNNKLVQDGKNGYLNQVGDHIGIAKSLSKLMENKDIRNQFGIESNKILRNNYSFDKFKKSYIQLISKNESFTYRR